MGFDTNPRILQMHQTAYLPEPLDASMYFTKLLPDLQQEIMIRHPNQLSQTRREMVDKAKTYWELLQFAWKRKRARESDTC
jgi:hypothetical protein